MFNMFSFSHSPRNQLANHGRKDERKFSHKLQTKQDQSAAITAAEDLSSGSQSQPLTEEPARQPWPESWKEVLLQTTDQARPASYGARLQVQSEDGTQVRPPPLPVGQQGARLQVRSEDGTPTSPPPLPVGRQEAVLQAQPVGTVQVAQLRAPATVTAAENFSSLQ